MNSIKIAVLFFTLLQFPEVIESQSLNIVDFNSTHRLPAKMIYSMFYDSKGFLWLGTDNGLIRWNGRNSKTYGVEDGLPNANVFKIYEDSYGRMWISTFSDEICFLKNGKVFNKSNYKILQNLKVEFGANILEVGNKLYLRKSKTKETHGVHYSIYLKADTFYIHYNITPESIIDSIFQKSKLNKNINRFKYPYSILKDLKNLYIIDTNKSLYNYLNTTLTTSTVVSSIQIPHWDGALIENHKDIIISRLKSTFVIDKNCFIQYIVDKENNIHIIYRKGYTCIKNENFNTHFDTYNESASRGFLLNNQLIISRSNRIYKIDSLSHKLSYWFQIKSETHGFEIRSIIQIQNDLVLATTDGEYRYNLLRNKLSRTYRAMNDHFSTKDLLKITPSGYLSSSHSNAYYFGDTIYKIYNDRCYTLFLNSENILWISTMKGLKYTPFNIANLKDLKFSQFAFSKKNNYFVNDIDEGIDRAMIFSKNVGLVVISANREYECKILSNMNCYQTEVDKTDSSIWVATNKGLYHLKYMDSKRIKFSILDVYLETDGFVSNEITDVKIWGNKVYAISDEEISIISKNGRYNREYTIPLYLDEIRVNDSLIQNRNYYFPKENNIKISFSAIYFKRNPRLKFHYELFGANYLIKDSDKEYIEFIGLPYGHYTLKVDVYDRDYPQVKSDTIEYSFEVLPNYWETAWFKCAMVLLFITFSYVYYQNKIRGILAEEKYRTESNKKISELKLQALKTKLNPHFIFNALASIQKFITINDQKTANKYLSSFAKLMRQFLNYSSSEFIRLNEEIAMLNNYLELEQFRFNFNFDYEIIVDNELNSKKALIPSILLQPFVENAIIHGVAHLDERKGIIKLYFKKKNDNLYCIIEDNGIGITLDKEESHEALNENHFLGILKERIKELSFILDEQIVLNIANLEDLGKKGTRIEIILPYKEIETR